MAKEIYYQNFDKESKEYLQELHGPEMIICYYLDKLGYHQVKEATDKEELKEFEKNILDNAEYYLEHHGWKEFENEEIVDEPEYEIGYDRYTGQPIKIYHD